MGTSAAVADLVVAPHSPSAGEMSCLTGTGATITSRNRTFDARHKRETASATVKEVEVVRRGLKRLETQIHELESRVQYVNPWVVQYMWELLCELRDKIGVRHREQPRQTWMAEKRGYDQCPRGTQPAINMRIKLSSLSPQRAPTATPDEMTAVVASGTRAPSMPLTPMRLFDESADFDGNCDGLDTSLSSESDNDGELSEHTAVTTADAVGFTTSTERRGEEDISVNGDRELGAGRSRVKGSRQLARHIAVVETRWRVYRLAHEESAARMELVLSENTQRMFFLFRLTSSLATAAHEKEPGRTPSVFLCPENDACARRNATRLRDQRHSRGAAPRQQEQREASDLPSPPCSETCGGLSPIAPTQTPSDFLSLLKGNDKYSTTQERSRQGDRRVSDTFDHDLNSVASNSRRQSGVDERDVDVVARTLLKNGDFMRQIVDEVSRRFAAQIRQADILTEGSMSSPQELPSALLLTVREAVGAIVGGHDEAFYNQVQGWLEHEQKERAAQEEQFWKRATNYQEDLRRCAASEREAEREILQEHQRLLVLGREDAESCRDVRRELLELCGEVMRAVEHLPHPSAVPVRSSDGADQLGVGSDVTRREKAELRLETLTTAVNSLLSDMEALRTKTVGALGQQEGWRKQTESRITTLQEGMVDVQEAVAIVARKSRAAEERLDTSKAQKTELDICMERLQGLERQLEALPSLLTATTTTPPPLPLPLSTNLTLSDEVNPMSVEEVMIRVQKILVSRNANKIGATIDPYTKAISALCTTLQQLNHLYNVGTGTFCGSLHLIFALPPFSVPRSLVTVCQAYLREHSAAELREAVNAIGFGFQIAKVLFDCYYWIQSHLLVVGGDAREAFQREENNTTLTGTNCRAQEESSSECVVPTSSLCKASSLLPAHDDDRAEASLPLADELPSNHQKTPAIGSSIAVQTEFSVAAQPFALSQAMQFTALPLVASNKEDASQPERQTAAPETPTALENLAMGSLSKTLGSHSSVVHHYHHYPYDSIVDNKHAFPTLKHIREEGKDVPLGVSGSRGQATLQRTETPLFEMSDPGEQVASLAVPSVNRSHVDVSGRRDVMTGCVASGGNRSFYLEPTPSMYDECLPLPTAVSSFVESQRTTNTTSHGQHTPKNPQPFYTALVQRGPCSHRNNISGGSRCEGSSGVRFDFCSGGDARRDAMLDSFERPCGFSSTATGGRNRVFGGVSTAKQRKNSSLDEKSLEKMRTKNRR